MDSRIGPRSVKDRPSGVAVSQEKRAAVFPCTVAQDAAQTLLLADQMCTPDRLQGREDASVAPERFRNQCQA